MTLTAGQQAELEKPVTRYAYFAEFSFLSATVYLSSLGQNVDWGGHTWLGFGSVGSISAVEENQGTTSSALIFNLNVAQIEWLSLATGNTNEYRGRDAKLYFCPLDEQFRLIDTPVVCWRGSMDAMQMSVDGAPDAAKGNIALKCETSAYGLKRKVNLRMNAAQQKQRHPADTGFDYLISLIGDPNANKWLSVRFQSK